MDIKEVQDKKRDTEAKIMALIKEFEKETGVIVSDIEVTKTYSKLGGGREVVVFEALNLQVKV